MHFCADTTEIHKLLEMSDFCCRTVIDLDHDKYPLIEIEFIDAASFISTQIVLDSVKARKLAIFLTQTAKIAEKKYANYWEEQTCRKDKEQN